MAAGFDFNEITLNSAADISKVMENFTKIENLGITDAKATRKASTTQDGWMSKEDKDKLNNIATGATNVTKTSQLTNDSGFITSSDIAGKENTSNKVTSISASSTDTQYASAKAVFNYIKYNIPGFVFGEYTGNGNRLNNAFANLGYLPRLLICFGWGNGSSSRVYGDVGIFMSSNNFSHIAFHSGYSGGTIYTDNTNSGDSAITLTTTSNGFSIETGSGFAPVLNVNNKKYTYLIIK